MFQIAGFLSPRGARVSARACVCAASSRTIHKMGKAAHQHGTNVRSSNPRKIDHYDRALSEFQEMLIPKGGGGPGSPRNKLSRLISTMNPRSRKQAGWVPVPAPIDGLAVALYDFSADPHQRGEHRELSFCAGDMLSMLRTAEVPEGWMIAANITGDVGLVPAAFVEVRCMHATVLMSQGFKDFARDFQAAHPEDMEAPAGAHQPNEGVVVSDDP